MTLHLSYHCLIALRVPHIKNLSSLFLTHGRSQPAQLAQLYPAPLLSRQAKVNMKDPSDSCFHLCCLTYFRTLVPRSLSGGLLYHTGRVSHLGFPHGLYVTPLSTHSLISGPQRELFRKSQAETHHHACNGGIASLRTS